jgi:hypothetical protein
MPQSVVMRTIIFLCCLIHAVLLAQPPAKSIWLPKKNQWVDSNLDKEGWKYFQDQYINQTDILEGEEQALFVPSILHASKDLYSSLTSFSFSIRRYRMKGLSSRYFTQSIQEVSMNQLSDGIIPWANWGGLNEVTSNNQLYTGLKQNDYQFGNLGSVNVMQLNASQLFPQTTFATTISNRNYQQRWAFTKVWAENKNGWAFAGSIAIKKGNGGMLISNQFNGFSYFVGVDKFYKRHLFSFILLGNRQWHTRQSAVTKELVGLSRSNLYQPGWGLHQGVIKPANGQFNHQPSVFLTHTYKSVETIEQATTFFYSQGEKYTTALDWYNAPDPRPDYYRYLPSFFTDTALANSVAEQIQMNPAQLQINWDHLYWVNQHASSDKRARYWIEDRVEQSNKLAMNTRFKILLKPSLEWTIQGQFKRECYQYFKRVNNLLGGSYTMNWNQFAEDNLPSSTAIQNDLNQPDQKVLTSERIGYHYQMVIKEWLFMTQLNYRLPRFDLFAALKYTHTIYQRTGFYRNGVFPLQSFGPSHPDHFRNLFVKTGLTYKMNGRNYLYLHGAISSLPPLVNDWYISPRSNAIKQSKQFSEHSLMIEAGYILNAPLLKLTLNGYFIQLTKGMDVMSFYHDGYRNLVNYALNNLSTQHIGIESSIAYQLTPSLSINAALHMGQFIYNQRPTYAVLADNEPFISETGILYINRFPLTGFPHTAYYTGLAYRSSSNWMVNLSGSFLGKQWISFNPLRRTYDASQNLAPNTAQSVLIQPTILPSEMVLDLSVGYSFRLKKLRNGKSYYIQCFLGMNNLMNRSMITGGFEQLRFDVQGGDINQFPNKYYFSNGLLYSCSLKFKL